MKERPTLFSGPMMRANMAGIKSVTRRTSGLDDINENPDGWFFNDLTIEGTELYASFSHMLNGKVARIRCPYGKPGDLLWARETYTPCNPFVEHQDNRNVIYRADGRDKHGNMHHCLEDAVWKPSIHMPRWASRITLEITGVRVERLNDISEQDAKAEGVEKSFGSSYKHYLDDKKDCGYATASFSSLWESINGAGSWNKNPWVWVISYDNPRRPMNNKCEKHGKLAEDGKCDVCEARGLWEGCDKPVPPEDIAAIMRTEFADD